MTTSVVSGIFAKYTISKQVLMMFSFESFGVTIEIIPSEGLQKAAGAGNIRFDESRNLTVSNLLMHPGNDFKDALKFQIKGKPTADAELKVEVTVANKDNVFDNSFKINDQAFPSLFTDTWANETEMPYVPMGFYVGDDYAVQPYSQVNAQEIGAAISAKVGTKQFAKGEPIGEKDILFGFDWQKDYNSQKDGCYDEIGTWISNKKPSFTITYKISVEQITGETNQGSN
jgi:hypothetical protein